MKNSGEFKLGKIPPCPILSVPLCRQTDQTIIYLCYVYLSVHPSISKTPAFHRVRLKLSLFLTSGSPVSACTDDKSWSRPSPTCVTACTYPGTAYGGIIDKVSFFIYFINIKKWQYFWRWSFTMRLEKLWDSLAAMVSNYQVNKNTIYHCTMET